MIAFQSQYFCHWLFTIKRPILMTWMFLIELVSLCKFVLKLIGILINGGFWKDFAFHFMGRFGWWNFKINLKISRKIRIKQENYQKFSKLSSNFESQRSIKFNMIDRNEEAHKFSLHSSQEFHLKNNEFQECQFSFSTAWKFFQNICFLSTQLILNWRHNHCIIHSAFRS